MRCASCKLGVFCVTGWLRLCPQVSCQRRSLHHQLGHQPVSSLRNWFKDLLWILLLRLSALPLRSAALGGCHAILALSMYGTSIVQQHCALCGTQQHRDSLLDPPGLFVCCNCCQRSTLPAQSTFRRSVALDLEGAAVPRPDLPIRLLDDGVAADDEASSSSDGGSDTGEACLSGDEDEAVLLESLAVGMFAALQPPTGPETGCDAGASSRPADASLDRGAKPTYRQRMH
jgi:hypothetical protein